MRDPRGKPPFDRIVSLVLLALLTQAGCLHLITSYRAQVENEILAAAKAVDQFYGELLEEDEGKRPYARFKERYVQIETDLRALVLRNEVRPLNEDSTTIVRNLLTLWTQKKDSHRQTNAYGSGSARLDRNRFATMFKYALRAETEKPRGDAEGGNNQGRR